MFGRVQFLDDVLILSTTLYGTEIPLKFAITINILLLAQLSEQR